MKFRGRRQHIRTMTPEQEGALVLRQRDRLMTWLSEREGWCPLVAINDVREFFKIEYEER